MVVLNTRFTLLAGVITIASVSAAPAPAQSAAIHARQDGQQQFPMQLPKAAARVKAGHWSRKGRLGHGKRSPDALYPLESITRMSAAVGLRGGRFNKRHLLELNLAPLLGLKDPITILKREQAPFSAKAANSTEACVPGVVDIMSPSSGSAAKRLASLALDNSTSTLMLNASDMNKTQICLIPSDDKGHVNLQVFMPNSSAAPHCATFNPSPPKAEPLTAEPCFNGTSPPPHKSQTFLYNADTGVIRPMWFDGEDDGTGSSSPSNTTATGQDPATPTNATAASVTDLTDRKARDAPAPPQNVTLVFVPSAPKVASNMAAESNSSSSMSSSSPITSASTSSGASASTSSSSIVLMTVTSTVTETSTAVVTTTSSLAAMEVSMTSSSASSTSPSTSSTAMSTSTSVPLNVEVSTPSSSSVAPSSSGSSSATASASSTSSADAEAVASAIASAEESSLSVESSTSMSTATATESSVTAVATDVPSSSASASSTESASSTDSEAQPSMTPVSTGEYEWRFKSGADERL